MWAATVARIAIRALPAKSRKSCDYLRHVTEMQRVELAEHEASAFPASVEKGEMYGEVDPVMIDADIVGWVRQGRLNPIQKGSLREAADQLARSLPALPSDARPYFERLVRLARRTAAT